jgi:2-polyprenyl-3-methyl-5-hydroxy-6-metoxy-1,4-benzoquinol methylase
MSEYIYDFDLLMHGFMIQSFLPFFIRGGNVLELGSFEGEFTKRLAPYFSSITCVEPSEISVMKAHEKLPKNVRFITAFMEKVTLPTRYDNIILTHVLEHILDPVFVLKRINNEWLADNGRLFLVCPNANAASRQIAVKMGLIASNSAVTESEKSHGHMRTYSLNTLETDVRKAGLKVSHSSGIFFKALANFQWDKLLKTDIISKEYLDGCYQLGLKYPDLCSSIFLMCEKDS